MKIGILGTSEIAFRRFLPALQKCSELTYAGVASRTPEKGMSFQKAFGGKVYDGYDALLDDAEIEAVYIPLPPALHFKWGKKALQVGKHVLMEKPFTTNITDTHALLSLAAEKELAVHENYMFLYHSQLAWIKEQVDAGAIGELRLIRTAFGFPKRGSDDFRYKKELGGGALLDCGGYPLRLASFLLGGSAHITAAKLNQSKEYDVDLYGNATMENDAGQTAQLAFGMDNSYKCELELWGSTGSMMASRIFTAPDGYQPAIRLCNASGEQQITLSADDSFKNSISLFCDLIASPDKRAKHAHDIEAESKFVEQVIRGGIHA